MNRLISARCIAYHRSINTARFACLSQQKRTFFGVGEILGVITNPGETLRQITESKRLLEEARQEIKDAKERSQIPRMHTFSALPNFFDRPNEIQAIKQALAGVPSLTVICGASSVGKTALLRQVLSSDRFHVLHFDLRIAGFADLSSLYYSLSMQMEEFFRTISEQLEGYQDFEKESWAFKHNRAAMDKRMESGGEVKTSDIAKLMELFQSSLLQYWQHSPVIEEGEEAYIDPSIETRIIEAERPYNLVVGGKAQKRPRKKIPVFFLDEAHKLPALIQSDATMKSFLDAILVLTKQDRLIHCIHATSDPFYMHWLRQMNILQHALLLSIGDVSKNEAKAFFQGRLLPSVPTELKSRFVFEDLYQVFGGKLSHLQDFAADFVHTNGEQVAKESSHYLQAYSLLNLHLIHSNSSIAGEGESAKGFQIYSPITQRAQDPEGSYTATSEDAAFSSKQLLSVMKKLQNAKELPWTLPYFAMCHEFGTKAIDGIIAGRILELRWSPAITLEEDLGNRKRPIFRGPELHPSTPVMRYAMSQILEEMSTQ